MRYIDVKLDGTPVQMEPVVIRQYNNLVDTVVVQLKSDMDGLVVEDYNVFVQTDLVRRDKIPLTPCRSSVDIVVEEGYLGYTWPIDSAVTRYKGVLQFEVQLEHKTDAAIPIWQSEVCELITVAPNICDNTALGDDGPAILQEVYQQLQTLDDQAEQAAASAADASESKRLATTSATNAAASNQNAATHEQAAKDYTDAAEQSATAAGQSATQAGRSATQAGQSATLAGQQADNAATHEQAAKDYTDAAEQSATAAGQSATAAAKSEAEAARYAAQIAGDIDSFYNRLALQVASKEAMDALFVEWWHENWVEGTTTRLELLERWFGSVLQDARTHGVKESLFATSNTAIAELTDDSVGLTCVPSTEAAANRDDFAGLPQFWALEVSWEKTTTGSIEVYAVELIDDIDVVRSGESHMCGVAQKNTYFRDWIVDGYHYLKTRCYPSSGYTQWDDGKTVDGVVHAFAIRPKYCTGGINKSGVATCGTNLAPMNSMAGPTTGVTKWRARGARYAGARGSALFWQLAMIRLKYARKGNSGTIEGCTNFYTHYAAAVSETAVSRILLTAAQAANLFVGCNTCIGDGEYASTKANNVRIKSITPVTVDGATYSAVILDTTTTFDVVAGTTKISVLPYWSGWCDMVKGNDGSRYSATSGKETGLIQKTEFQNGAYQILADELWQWGKDADGNFTFDCYTCDDQSKVTTGGTVSADYKKLEGATMTFPADQGNGWLYIEDMMAMPGGRTLWPRKVSAQAGSGTGVKAGFFCYPAASGLRAAWCCCNLNYGGYAGLAARNSSAASGTRAGAVRSAVHLWLGKSGVNRR